MRIEVKKAQRKSIAYILAPEELTIIIPEDGDAETKIGKVLSSANGSFDSKELTSLDEFHQMLDGWVEKLEVTPQRVQIKKMKTKWASCSLEKNLTFNSNLTNMPKEFVSYVICHELLHFKVPKHNKLFKSLLTAYMPDWKERVSRTINCILFSKPYDQVRTNKRIFC